MFIAQLPQTADKLTVKTCILVYLERKTKTCDLPVSLKYLNFRCGRNIMIFPFFFFFSENKYHSLPLFGHFCCRLAAQPECVSKEMCIGNVTVDGQDCWARLQGFTIKTWESKKHAEETQNPERVLPINKVS